MSALWLVEKLPKSPGPLGITLLRRSNVSPLMLKRSCPLVSLMLAQPSSVLSGVLMATGVRCRSQPELAKGMKVCWLVGTCANEQSDAESGERGTHGPSR
ncbi:MAG: hypothetical protein IPL64_04420 [Flavobacteriales bacterium]|nr:hypothetical protein [Flavobacteriales bacterium]